MIWIHPLPLYNVMITGGRVKDWQWHGYLELIIDYLMCGMIGLGFGFGYFLHSLCIGKQKLKDLM